MNSYYISVEHNLKLIFQRVFKNKLQNKDIKQKYSS